MNPDGSENSLLNELERLSNFENIEFLKEGIQYLLKRNFVSDYALLKEDLSQALEAQTLQRSRYYIRRLMKTLSKEKPSKYNDLDMNRWKQYGDILTESLWQFDKRGAAGAHQAGYWGNFIPQIPNQFLRRYTKKNEWIFDAFLGSGTTLIECRRLGRNGIGIELQKSVAEETEKLIQSEQNPWRIHTSVYCGDSSAISVGNILAENGIANYQFLMLHPPYWDIIRFSSNEKDLSNARTVEKFLEGLGKVVKNTAAYLEKGRFAALVIGDKYAGGEWIPLGFYAMQTVLKYGFRLKSIIIKNFEDTRGKRAQKELWRYRALLGGFYIFKHEYIFLFQKTGPVSQKSIDNSPDFGKTIR